MDQSKTTAKDFFLHLGSMVGLYAVAISFITLLFRVIDKAYPEVVNYYYGASNISFPVATLIIFFPIFILLSWLNEKSYAVDPNKKQIAIRRWLVYITLFVAGVILAGDLVYILYKFLDGQNLTSAFLLKALATILVAGGVFGFYIQDVREKIGRGGKRMWAVVTAIIILVAIILGFSIIGSPMKQRLMRYDDQKVSDLQNIQYQVVNYFQKKGVLPATLTEVADPISGNTISVDQQTGKPYEYKLTGNMTFQLCADFNLDSTNPGNYPKVMPMMYPAPTTDGYWDHKTGHTCFDRTIDPKLYPVYKN